MSSDNSPVTNIYLKYGASHTVINLSNHMAWNQVGNEHMDIAFTDLTLLGFERYFGIAIVTTASRGTRVAEF